jgi:hypothetical protein
MATVPALHLRRHRRGIGIAAVVLAVAGVAAITAWPRSDDARSNAATAAVAGEEQTAPAPPAPSGPFSLRVDESLVPAVETVDGFAPGDPVRPVGRLADADGTVTDLVLDELVVTSFSAAQFEAFLERWDAEVVHSYPAEPDGSQDHLVRFDSAAVGDGAAPDQVAADLLEMEPYHAGEMRLGHPGVLGVLAVTAHETVHGGPVVSPNFVAEDAGIDERSMSEHFDRSDAWGWSYLQDGGTQDFGVTGAWEILQHAGRLDRNVNVLVFDGGFYENPDFPLDPTIRGAAWGDRNPLTCTGDKPCPWHGTNVAITAVGQGDNLWGSVGPGGPVGRLIAVERHGGIYDQLRDLVEMVDVEFANVVNLSYSFRTTVAQAGHRLSFDRRLTKIDDRALIVASAGNDGENVDAQTCTSVSCWENKLTMPCESTHVLCVGGLGSDTTERHDSSNYGTVDDGESVELYGPYLVLVPGTDEDGFLTGGTVWSGGTSYSAPFVAGIAALMESATEHGISPGQLQELLLRTANVGGLGSEVTGSQRRVNARAAAADLLGIETSAPQVSITSHETGDEILAQDFLALFGEATDFLGRDLPIRWMSNVQGDLGTTAPGENIGPELEVGVHALVASATDFVGQTTHTQITVTVVDNPPVLSIGAPLDGAVYHTGQDVGLLGVAQDQDVWLSLPDDAVAWTVLRSNGATVATDSGLHGSFTPTSPGTYEIVFATVDGEVATSVSITVENPPPGTPVVTIEAPAPFTENGGAPIELRGAATVDGNPLTGTRLRWVAVAGDTEVELCRGSAFDVTAGDDLGIVDGPPVSCTVSQAELFYVDTGETVGTTAWTIRLEARSPGGLVGLDEVVVDFEFAVG